MKRKSRNGAHANENNMVNSLDKLVAYEEYTQTVLPKLQKAIAEKWSVEKIYQEFQALIAARIITAALTEPDNAKALAASKEILDRSMGKATEKVETTHKYSKLSDAELDNLLTSTLGTMDEDTIQ